MVKHPSDTQSTGASGAKTDERVDRVCCHCGLATREFESTPPNEVFCCAGCRSAYQWIHAWGLSDFYALRDQLAIAPPNQVAGERSRYDQFDHDEFLGDSAPVLGADGLLSARMAVHGLHCGACVWLIENAASHVDGWSLARVKMSDHTVQLVYDGNQIALSDIARTMDRLGYPLVPLTGQAADQVAIENRKLLVQIAVAGFCAANAMWIAIALYAGDATGVAAEHRQYLRLIGTALGLISVAIPGRTFFRGAIASLRTGTPHMDLPVALGLSVGSVAGTVDALLNRGDIYFDSLATLVFLLLLGRWIQFRQQQHAAKQVDLLMRITPRHAHRIVDDEHTEIVLVELLQPGQCVRVAPGESIPVDGVIVSGQSMLDWSLLTGESKLVVGSTGDAVAAGIVNVAQGIDVQVEAIGSESRIGRVMHALESAMLDKTPMVQLADRIGGVFVVVVMVLAVVTFAVWFPSGGAAAAAHATALLIVACPCALALATPLAIAVSLGRAAGQKILIRDGGCLQSLARPGKIWFDKTGTLTEGRSRVVHSDGDLSAIPLAAAVEDKVCHPIADAIVKHWGVGAHRNPSQGLRWQASQVTLYPGGVIGRCEPIDVESGEVGSGEVGSGEVGSGEVGSGEVIEPAAHWVAIGNLAFAQTRGIETPVNLSQAVDRFVAAGNTSVVIAIDGVARCALAIDDPLRADAKSTVDQLRRLGWQIGILSGDHPSVVKTVAQRIGVDEQFALGGLSPEEKLAMVGKAPLPDSGGDERRSPDAPMASVMVGDGANDAAALAAADVGVAVRGGAEVCMQAAPVYIASGNLSSLLDLVRGARSTTRLIHLTFALSLGYNIVAVALAISGRIGPLVAAILMPISSVSVLSLTLASRTFRNETPTANGRK